jgi:hypothetical protein
MNDTDALVRSKALADQQDSLNEMLTRLTEKSHQVWVKTPEGGVYAYRTDLPYSVASALALCWNQNTPADVSTGTTFHVVEQTTTFRNV